MISTWLSPGRAASGLLTMAILSVVLVLVRCIWWYLLRVSKEVRVGWAFSSWTRSCPWSSIIQRKLSLTTAWCCRSRLPKLMFCLHRSRIYLFLLLSWVSSSSLIWTRLLLLMLLLKQHLLLLQNLNLVCILHWGWSLCVRWWIGRNHIFFCITSRVVFVISSIIMKVKLSPMGWIAFGS
jgi:hypothetical protein